MKDDDLDRLPVGSPLFARPAAYLSGIILATGAALLWSLWWPLGALAYLVIVIAGCVALHARDALEISLDAEREANRNTEQGEAF